MQVAQQMLLLGSTISFRLLLRMTPFFDVAHAKASPLNPARVWCRQRRGVVTRPRTCAVLLSSARRSVPHLALAPKRVANHHAALGMSFRVCENPTTRPAPPSARFHVVVAGRCCCQLLPWTLPPWGGGR